MNIPPYGDTYRKVMQPFANLRVTAKYTPEMRVWVSAGGYWNYTSSGMTYVEYNGGNSPEISAPATGSKWVVVTINSSGMVGILDGTPASSNPSLPTIPRGQVPLAAIYVQSTTVKITNDMIFDIRPTGFDVIPKSHIDLENVTVAGCHPIAAITDLETQLSRLAPIESVVSALATKADIEGTLETTFTLNKDQTGSPSSNCSFEVERGALDNVRIRWNESSDQWEYTDDGSTYVAFNSLFVNDGTSTINIKLYEQDDQPTLTADGEACFWKDTDDSDKIYLVFRRADSDYVKVQLT